MTRSSIDGITEALRKSKPKSFLTNPVPECSCLRYEPAKMSLNASTQSGRAQVEAVLGVTHRCPAWMDSDLIPGPKDKESDEDLDEDVPLSSGSFFRYFGENHENGAGEVNKEDVQLEDSEELEGMEK